jgi:hypothetical protein
MIQYERYLNYEKIVPLVLRNERYRYIDTFLTIFEPRHDKTNNMGLLPAWIQTSLRIRAV